jgi:gliding motility-associated-like protein
MKQLLFAAILAITPTLGWTQCGYTGCPTVSVSGTDVFCNGGNNGTITLSIIQASSDWEVYWSISPQPPINTLSLTGLSAGTYSALFKDNCTGCTISLSYTVNSPAPILLNTSVTDVLCFGQNNGTVTVVPTGGTTPYYYDWDMDGLGTYDDIATENAGAGFHSLNVKDGNDCVVSTQVYVNQPLTPVAITYDVTDVDCNGQSSGEIDVIMNGSGTPPYSYAWSTGDATEDVSGLAANTYTVTVTDGNFCSASENITVDQPNAPLSSSIVTTDVTCNGYSDGELTVGPTGGTPPYNYSWSSSYYNYSVDNPTLSGVPVDNYSVVITDSEGCTHSNGEVVNSPLPLSIATESITNVSCHDFSDGQIDVEITGGTSSGDYTYSLFSNDAGIIIQSITSTNASFTSLEDGTYTLSVTDDNLCLLTKEYEVTEPEFDLEIITDDIINVLCYGLNTGGVNITPFGGTPDYTFTWENSSGANMGATQDLAGLFSDTYTLTLNDDNGCQAQENFLVDQPSDTLQASNNISPVVCFGESNGVVDLNTTGGTTPYSFAWANSSYLLSTTSEDLINYPSDTYTVIITDGQNCQFYDTLIISEPPLLTGSLSGVDILCKGENTGAVDLTIGGGTISYSFNWSNGATTEDINTLFADSYYIQVTDGNFCTWEDSITLTEPMDTLGYTFISNPVVCHGEANGSIELTPTGGSPLYSVTWSSGDDTETITDLTAGWYTFDLIDNNGCQVVDSIEVIQPDLLLANEAVTDVTCNGFSDGIIDISPSGGTPPYNYTWFNSTYALSSQEQDLINFPSDTYQLELRDTLDCLTEIFIFLPEPDSLKIEIETVNVTCAGGSDGLIDIEVSGGNPGYNYLWSPNGETSQDLSSIPADDYIVFVTDTKNCLDSASIMISQPDSIKIDFLMTEVSCADQFDGTATAFPYGGTGDFTYLWDTDETTAGIEGLFGGMYTVEVEDIVGCTASDSVFVSTNPIACIIPPTAFTPNGDYYNDTWFLKNIEIYPNMEIKIFNRWGNLLYEQANLYEEWNGVYNGQPLPSETYYYIINLNTNLEPLRGTVTIVR